MLTILIIISLMSHSVWSQEEAESTSKNITCGDTVSAFMEAESTKFTRYQLTITGPNNVHFDDCGSTVHVFLIISDSSGNNINNNSCPNGNDCGRCGGSLERGHENFTINNMSAGVYTIEAAWREWLGRNDGYFNLSVNCVSASPNPTFEPTKDHTNIPSIAPTNAPSTNITCGDTVSAFVTEGRYYNESKININYQLIITGPNDVYFDDCRSTADVSLIVRDSLGNNINNNSCPNGNDCGQCNNDLENEYENENFTISNISAGVYTIDWEWLGGQEGYFNLSVNCVSLSYNPTKNITCGEVIQDISNDFNADLYELFITDSYMFVDFQVCTDNMELDFLITDNKTTDITPESESIAGLCTDGNAAEIFTVPNVSTGVYLITMDPMSDTEGGSYGLTVDCVTQSCEGNDEAIIAFAISGIIQVTITAIALWFVIGYFIRFRSECEDHKLMMCSAIGCLFLGFMHGCVRTFVLTNVFVPGADVILQTRCDGLFWYQMFTLQLGQLFLYIYLLTKLQSINQAINHLFPNAMYYFLLLLVSFMVLFSAAVIPWYAVPEVENGSCGSELAMCITAKPGDIGVYDEYAIFLVRTVVVQMALLFAFLYQFYQLCTESGCCTCGRNTFTYRILTLGTVIIFVHFAEFVYFYVTEETFHAILFIIYAIVILASFRVCAVNEKTGDSAWCCWCCMDDKGYSKVNVTAQMQQEQECESESVDEIEDDCIGSKVRGVVIIKREVNVGLI